MPKKIYPKGIITFFLSDLGVADLSIGGNSIGPTDQDFCV